MDNLVLIGMPASGKSTAGALAAKRLGYAFIECDALIAEREGAALSEIIEKVGAEGFIAVEEGVLCSLNCVNSVISTGGSACYSERAMQHLKSLGTVVYLKVPLTEVKRRIPDFTARGVVMRGDIATLDDLYKERIPLYEHYADITVDCENRSIEETVAAIVAAYKEIK